MEEVEEVEKSESSYESVESEVGERKKRKKVIDKDAFDLLLYNEQGDRSVQKGGESELGVIIQGHDARNKQIEILKEQTDARVEEFSTSLLERIEQIEKNFTKELHINDEDQTRQLQK